MSDSVEREVTTEVEVGLSSLLPTARLKRTVTRRWSERAEQFQHDVSAGAGMSPTDLEERLTEQEALTDAYVRAAEAAVRTPDPLHRTMIARTIAAGLRDDALIDEAIYYADLIVQLAPVHLRLLNVFDGYERRFQSFEPPIGRKVEGLIRVKQVCDEAHVPYAVACSASERLRSLGLLTDVVLPSSDRMSIGVASDEFRITQWGSELLAFCRRVVDAAE